MASTASKRVGALQRHLERKGPRGSAFRTLQCGPHLVEYAECPGVDPQVFEAVLTPGALQFLAELVHQMDNGIDQLYRRRRGIQNDIEAGKYRFEFLEETRHVREGSWQVAPLPPRMQDRRVDVGDVSPDDALSMVLALNSGAQGVQCDFDDGFCPTYANVLQAIANISLASRGRLQAKDASGRTVSMVADPAIMMLRPRAWNMVETHAFVNGKAVPGPLFDFGLLIYHCGAALHSTGRGPFFYCSKVENYLEARLWNQVFTWAEHTLHLPSGCIKACVLIENITASFQMDEILHELREHSAGLNCGIWDYSASFVARFASRSDMVFPDRTKYVNMKCPFMRAYMRLLVETCHRRGALATTGMSALVLDPTWSPATVQEKVAGVRDAKDYEAQAGADGALVYDITLCTDVREVFTAELEARARRGPTPRPSIDEIAADLLSVPPGGITMDGVRFNVSIGLRFIESWCRGRGSFVYRHAAEDSATAEISRSQIWQWVHHGKHTEDGQAITMDVVQRFIGLSSQELEADLVAAGEDQETVRARVSIAVRLLEAVTRTRAFPQFLTTYLYDQMLFQGAVEWQV